LKDRQIHFADQALRFHLNHKKIWNIYLI
jgi:hypothetical protein